jgi:hypothetical protein
MTEQAEYFLCERMGRMRDFSWKYFTMTGDVESYLLYKEFDYQTSVRPEEEEDIVSDDADELN